MVYESNEMANILISVLRSKTFWLLNLHGIEPFRNYVDIMESILRSFSSGSQQSPRRCCGSWVWHLVVH